MFCPQVWALLCATYSTVCNHHFHSKCTWSRYDRDSGVPLGLRFYKQFPLTFQWNVMLRFRNHNFCCISVTEGDHQDEAPKVISEVWKTWASWQKICWKCIQLCASLENLSKPQKMIPILWGRFSILLKLSHRGQINGGITFEMDTISELWDLLTLTSQMVSNGYYLVTSKREMIITKGVVS